LAALLVGRWPSGAPVKSSQSEDPGASPVDNEFDFADDPEAAICPFGAHIRKVNPRKGRSDRVDVPRILRRGIPFGPRSDDDPAAKQRGLLFLAFQTSISGQFEFLSQHWMNSAQNPGPGFDLLVGRSTGNRQLKIQGPNGPVTISDGGRQWITPSGGGYLFAPGKRALAKFNTPRAAIGLWKAKLLLAQTKDLLKNTFTQQID
jgi:deferrochelatase/peroxidase EfeB